MPRTNYCILCSVVAAFEPWAYAKLRTGSTQIWVVAGVDQNETLIIDDLQLANLFNNYFSQIGYELREQIPINVKGPLSFFDIADRNKSAFRFYDSSPDEVRTLIGKFPNKGSLFDKIPT